MTEARRLTERATRLDNDINGNPRYYIAKYQLPEMTEKTRKAAGLMLYRGRRFGSGYVLQSYSLESDIQFVLDKIAADKAEG